MPLLIEPSDTANAKPAAWRHCIETDDIDAHAASQPEWALRYDQLSSGRFHGSVRHVQLPGVRVVEEAANQAVRQRGDMGRDAYGFAIALNLPAAAYFDGQRLNASSVMVGRADSLDLCTPAQFSMIAAVISADLMNGFWEKIHGAPPPAWLDQQTVVAVEPETINALKALHLGALEALSGANVDDMGLMQFRDAVLMEWIEAMPTSIDLLDLKTSAARKRVVDRACDLMLAHTEEPLSILQVCSRIGASRRKLNYCFQDTLGITPVKYLRAIRLNRVRRELKQVRDLRTGVQDIATRWGFWHFGQFSLDYKLQFGELPSATLRTARIG